MIRRFSFIIMGLACVAVLGASWPVLAQSNLFLKRGDKEETEGEAPKSKYFVPFFSKKSTKKSKKKVFTGRKIVKENNNLGVYKLAKDVDPRLLTMVGPGPSNNRELQAVAAAYKAPKIAAVMERRQKNQQMLAKLNQAKRKPVAISKPGASHAAVKADSSEEKPKKKVIYNTGKKGFKKPKRVFSNFR